MPCSQTLAFVLCRQKIKPAVGSTFRFHKKQTHIIKHVWQGVLAASMVAGTNTPALSLPVTTKALPAYCARIPPASASLPGASTAIYRTVGNRPLRIHVFAPEIAPKRSPAAIFFFGGGFRTGDVASFTDIAKAFAARGYVAAVPDYRILCRDGITAVGGVEDAKAALAWIRAQASGLRIDRKRIALIGGSAGGLLAASTGLRAAKRERPAALVLLNPVLDLETGLWAQDQSPDEAAAYSPSRLPLIGMPPTIVIHGTADKTVPILKSRDFCTRAKDVGRTCELVEYQGMDHGFYNKQDVDPALGVSPFQDILRRTFQFLDPIMSPNVQRLPASGRSGR